MRTLVVPAVLVLLATPLGAQAATPATSAAPAAGRASGAACSSPSHTALTRELVAISGTERQMKESAAAVIEAQLRAAPQVAEYIGDVLREFMTEQLDWKYFEPEFVNLYCDLFTESEIRGMLEFNRTPLGQKIIATMPEVMRRAMAISEARTQANMPELQRRLEARMAKLRAEGKLPD